MKLLDIPAPSAALQKELVASVGSRLWPVYLVNEYPKSGGTWLKFMLAEALGLPAWTRGRPAWRSSVMQAHWLRPKGRCRVVVLFRDGRDVMVSFYYHCFFRNEFLNESLVRTMRERFDFTDFEDIRSNLPAFMKGILEEPITPGFTWRDFVRRWADDRDSVKCRYEDLRLDTAAELTRLVRELVGAELGRAEAERIAARYSMENMRARAALLNPGITGRQVAELSFLRKGKAGNWSESFTDEALAWFEAEHAAELGRLGYRLGRPDGR